MIYIVVPSAPTKKIVTGNYQTGFRYVKILQKLGIKSHLLFDYEFSKIFDKPEGVILLHANKNHQTAMTCQKKLIPYALVLTGTDIYSDLAQPKKTCYKNCLESIYGAKVIIALQPHAKQKLLDLIPNFKTKIFVIFQSTNISIQNHPFKENKKEISIIMVGNIRKEKDTLTGIDGFLEAYSMCNKVTDRLIKLTHVGIQLTGSYGIIVKKQGQKNKNIRFLGLRNNADVISIMKDSDLLLNTSIIEGGCLVVKEAIDLELPILASNIPCHKEMLGSDYPGIFAAENCTDLSNKLKQFILDKKTREYWKESIAKSPIATYTKKHEAQLLDEVVNSLR